MLRPSRLAPLVALLVALLLVGGSLLEGQQPSQYVGYGTGGSVAPLVVEDANTVAQRNSTNPQAFNLYGTFTDASNYERLAVEYDGANTRYDLEAQAAGTGTVRAIRIGRADLATTGLTISTIVELKSTNYVDVTTGGGTKAWRFDNGTSGGALIWPSTTFAALGTPANGTMVYCSDCTFANPCAGAGSGAFAKRLNGAWRCD